MNDKALSQEPICDRDCEHCTWTECPIEPCDEKRDCSTCKYEHNDGHTQPCRDCGTLLESYTNWEQKTQQEPCDDTVSIRKDIDGIKTEIKTEISDYEGCADFYEGIRFGLRTALEIIDKHIVGKENATPIPDNATNGDVFKQIFGIYATELWAKPESEFLEWLNGRYRKGGKA